MGVDYREILNLLTNHITTNTRADVEAISNEIEKRLERNSQYLTSEISDEQKSEVISLRRETSSEKPLVALVSTITDGIDCSECSDVIIAAPQGLL